MNREKRSWHGRSRDDVRRWLGPEVAHRYNYITKLYRLRSRLADDETACLDVASSIHISGFYYVTKPNEVLGRDQIAVLEGESHRVWEAECWTVVSVPDKKMFGGLWG